ncbi:MAG: Smr/MutS family protein [Candidatus Binatia bacterium]
MGLLLKADRWRLNGIFRPQMVPPRKDRSGNFSDNPSEASPFDEPVVLPIQDYIDLHAFSPRDIPSVVEEYIEQCSQAGIYEVRVIHGRGKGIQRRMVRSVLEKNSFVSSFRDALPESGGWGATLVRIRRY